MEPLFLEGTIENDFAPQLKSLPKHEIKVVCWDPPGFGKSRPPPRNYTIDFLRKDAMVAANMMKVCTLAHLFFMLILLTLEN